MAKSSTSFALPFLFLLISGDPHVISPLFAWTIHYIWMTLELHCDTWSIADTRKLRGEDNLFYSIPRDYFGVHIKMLYSSSLEFEMLPSIMENQPCLRHVSWCLFCRGIDHAEGGGLLDCGGRRRLSRPREMPGNVHPLLERGRSDRVLLPTRRRRDTVRSMHLWLQERCTLPSVGSSQMSTFGSLSDIPLNRCV